MKRVGLSEDHPSSNFMDWRYTIKTICTKQKQRKWIAHVSRRQNDRLKISTLYITFERRAWWIPGRAITVGLRNLFLSLRIVLRERFDKFEPPMRLSIRSMNTWSFPIWKRLLFDMFHQWNFVLMIRILFHACKRCTSETESKLHFEPLIFAF